MDKTFKLTINMGNEAMQTDEDLKEALRIVIKKLEFSNDGVIMDDNGNKVGEFSITELDRFITK